MSVIKREEYLLGIKFWCAFYAYLKPQIEVFRYVGRDLDSGIYYFQSIKRSFLIGKSFYQLKTPTFYPFLLDWKRIQEEVTKIEQRGGKVDVPFI